MGGVEKGQGLRGNKAYANLIAHLYSNESSYLRGCSQKPGTSATACP